MMPPPDKTDRDIILAGFYGQANFGDDLLAYYMLTHLTAGMETSRIIVSAPEGSYLERWFPGILALPRKKALVSKSKVQRKFIFGGGGQFFAFPPVNLSNLYGATTCTATRYWRLVPELAAGRARAYAFCVGAGPFAGIGARLATRILLNHCEAISVRDTASQELLAKMRVKHARLGADPSLGISLPSGVPVPAGQKTKSLGIIIRKWRHAPDTTALIYELVRAAQALGREGWQVEFISFQGEYDRETIQLLGKAGELTRIWTPTSESVDGFLRYLAGFRVFVSMRAHGIFLAPGLGVIPIAVALEPKLRNALHNSGDDHNLLSTTATQDEILRMVEAASKTDMMRINPIYQLQALAAETGMLLRWICTS